MQGTKSGFLVVASLLFLVAALIYSSISVRPVFAADEECLPSPNYSCYHKVCVSVNQSGFTWYGGVGYPSLGAHFDRKCTWYYSLGGKWEQVCHYTYGKDEHNTTGWLKTGCDEAFFLAGPSATYCPDGSVPDANGKCPPVTQGSPSCPDGSAPDANGNCPPTTQGSPTTPNDQGTTKPVGPPANLIPTSCPDGSTPDANGNCPAVNQGTIQSPPPPPPTVDNTPTNHHKGGSDLSQSPALTGGGDNNKPSKHHKGGNDISTPPS